MSQIGELDVLKEIPGYKVILKSVIKSQIQLLIEQLSDQTGEESIILTASVNDGTLTHLGSNMGKGFFEGHDDIKSQFLGYCLKNYHRGLEGGRRRKSSQSESKINTNSYQQGPSISKRQKVQQSNTGSVSSSYSEPFPQYLPTGGSQKSQPQLVATSTSEHSRIASFTANEGRCSQVMDTQNVFDTSHVKVEPGSVSQGSSSSVTQDQSTSGLTFHTTMMNTSSFGHESNNHIFNNDRQSIDSGLQENNDSHQGTTEETRVKTEHAEESDAELEITAVELATGSSDFQHDTGQTTSVGMGYQLLEQGERPENQTKPSGDRVEKGDTKVSKKRHICNYCGKLFPGRVKLELHIKVHTKEKDFICRLCKRGFSRKDTLRLHVWNKHSEMVHLLKEEMS